MTPDESGDELGDSSGAYEESDALSEAAALEEELAAAEEGARLAREFRNRFLIKTAIRCVLWFLAAAGFAYLFPGHPWIWFVAAAFFIIAVVVAIVSIVLSLVTEHRLRNLRRANP